MAGTKLGGQRAAQTNKERFGVAAPKALPIRPLMDWIGISRRALKAAVYQDVVKT